MEHEARFTRIEATLERLADAQLRGEYALTDAVEQMARSHKQLLTSQVLMVDEIRKLAEVQAKQAEVQAKHAEVQAKQAEVQAKHAEVQGKHAVEHDDLKEKLHLLFDVVDTWIREHGKNGNPTPADPGTPAA